MADRMGGIAAAAGLLVAVLGLAAVAQHRRRKKVRKGSSYYQWQTTKDLIPPLPEEVTKLLESCALCYLSTSSQGAPHLSLMNFTYSKEHELVILSTRRNTRKFNDLLKSPKIALLVHDFDELTSSGSPTKSSITLYGRAKAVEGEFAEK
jgi:hypothetical protein